MPNPTNRLSAHFTAAELKCRCCGVCHIQPNLLKALEHLRKLCCDVAGHDVPLNPNSGFRCTLNNDSLVDPITGKRLSSPYSQHLVGSACDLRVPKDFTMEQFAEIAEDVPQFATGGLGRYSWGIHVDTRGIRARWR